MTHAPALADQPSLLAEIVSVLLFQAGYNTGVVLAGTAVLGAAAGLTGSLVVLRRRALMSDSISHSTLPGVGLGFLMGLALFGQGRMLWTLMAGALVTSILGVLSVQWIRDNTRLPEDAAIGTVLSVYYGFGIVLLSIIQSLDVDGKAGLNGFLLGSAASLRLGEAWFIAAVSLAVAGLTLALRKEFALLCFDRDFAASDGWPVRMLDLALMGLLLVIVSVGLKTVGMVLIIAIVIIPAVAARFWTDRIGPMMGIAAGIGGASAGIGVALSAVLPDLPTGAVIVLTAGGAFLASLMLGSANGLAVTSLRRGLWRYRIWECRALEQARAGTGPRSALLRLLGHVGRDGRLTPRGERLADAHLCREVAPHRAGPIRGRQP
ncbi:MAG: metal ABC transporter permease [Alphaproteobacteria bacterium]